MTNQIYDEKSQAGSLVAGTLVHTKEGLRPIEEIKVGDYVLSKPENGGELAYKRVTKTFVREDSEVWGVTYGYALNKAAVLVTTAEHPFWVTKLAVKDPSVKFGGMYIPHEKWVTATEMFKTNDNYYKGKGENAGYYLSAYDGKKYPVGEATPICMATSKPKRNRVADFSGSEFGVLWPVTPDSQRAAMGGVDFRVSPPVPLTLPEPHTNIMSTNDLDKNSRNSDKTTWVAGTTEFYTRGYQPKRCTVYNLEVEDFHTYFVGEHGIWVHNTCKNAALEK